ncbi:unnamed protein product [Brachionus calyciflorus]|uniref:Uncharacterized protein n=1 Tax=Brachionus calyciflorus TaxID=104777 RepID=A0A814BX90_9BILA|nr:unnamed protein product [Brachionus calyciflorus]
MVLSESVRNKVNKKPITRDESMDSNSSEQSGESDQEEELNSFDNSVNKSSLNKNINRCLNYDKCHGMGNLDSTKKRHLITKYCPFNSLFNVKENSGYLPVALLNESDLDASVDLDYIPNLKEKNK